MREIKFRAWNIEQKRMITGNDLCVSFQAGSFGVYDLSVSEQCLGDSIEFILEQSTGLKDKNGVEGYFGDVVEDEGDRYIVEWDSGDGVAYLESCLDSSEDREIRAIKTCKIIGNIHEEKP